MKHGMTGQKNALKDEGNKKATQLQIRVKVEDKARWQAAAGEETLTQWITKTLNRAAK